MFLTMMELVCEKHKEKMTADGAQCWHPKEYCKFRTSCVIHFLEREVKQEAKNEVRMTELRFDKGVGLLPAIAQDYLTNEVLMLAYINQEAWSKTLETGKAHYWSRSRNKIWLKGESSHHYQLVKEILIDCDSDTVIYKVEQLGDAACHTGHRSCFYRRIGKEGVEVTSERVFDPEEVYRK